MMGDGAGALDGIQVLDLSMDFAGALVAMTLADHGAEVIRIASEGALERDNFMTADLAKEFGLIDRVIESRDSIEPEAK